MVMLHWRLINDRDGRSMVKQTIAEVLNRRGWIALDRQRFVESASPKAHCHATPDPLPADRHCNAALSLLERRCADSDTAKSGSDAKSDHFDASGRQPAADQGLVFYARLRGPDASGTQVRLS
jgi:hypothetical protein